MNKFSIKRIDDNKVKDYWKYSPQCNVFTNPDVLKQTSVEVHWWGVFKGEENQCIWPITLNEKQKPVLPPFSYWQGPMWTKIGYDFPFHRSVSQLKSIYELFITTFIEEYGSFKASLHPSLYDVRVFDWWNYDKPDLPKFNIKPRYTAVLPNLQIPIDLLKKNFRINRRRALKKFKKSENEIYFDDKCSEAEFIWLYKEKLKIEKEVSNQDLISLLKIVDMGFGCVQAARRKKDDLICGLIITFYYQNKANLVINLVLDEYKKKDLMPGSIFNLLKSLRSKGIEYFDFNGANSPSRGDDKHSYGAEPILYFDIEYNHIDNV